MEARVTDNAELSRFEIYVGDVRAGMATYHRSEGVIAFDHTEIAPEFEGQGLAGQLARAALDSARERNLAVLPFCPYFRGWIAKHPEYTDLVPRTQRARFELPED